MALTTIITLISTLANILLSALGDQGVLSSKLSSLIGDLLSAILPLFTVFTSGSTPVNELQGVLTTLQSIDTALATDASLDPTALAQAKEALKDTQAAITAYQAAMVTTDPSTLTPLP